MGGNECEGGKSLRKNHCGNTRRRMRTRCICRLNRLSATERVRYECTRVSGSRKTVASITAITKDAYTESSSSSSSSPVVRPEGHTARVAIREAIKNEWFLIACDDVVATRVVKENEKKEL